MKITAYLFASAAMFASLAVLVACGFTRPLSLRELTVFVFALCALQALRGANESQESPRKR
jgi:hypothetical protein